MFSPITRYLLVALFLCSSVAAFAQRWEKLTLPAPYDAGSYLDVFFLPSDPLYGWACDRFNGYVVRTTNGGTTWSGTTVTGTVATNVHLEYIQFLNKNVGYTSGPGGAYKSVDGGGTWTKLAVPPAIDSSQVWGGWFRDENNGWFAQHECSAPACIYRTTDGGATFTKWVDSTALTRVNFSDPYKPAATGADTVYAVGVGAIWRSVDDGVSFAKLANVDTSMPWIEELAILGNSILVPKSRGDCAGTTFVGGGMSFSKNMGQTWTSTNLGSQMFGSCLIDSVTGWVAGFGPTVQHTTNGGATWVSKICGLEPRKDMDDIYFLNDSTGWVCGANGIYKLAKPLRKASDSLLTFTGVCPDSTAKDTVYFENINFLSSPVSYSISGPDAAQFTILNGPLPNSINSCTSHIAIVGYRATLPGVKTAQLIARFSNPDTTIFVDLRGDRKLLTARPAQNSITINMRVGSPGLSRTLQWQATQAPFEQIIDIVRDSGDTSISMSAPLPLNVSLLPVNTNITANPIDTGFTQAKFKVRLWPCVHDTIIVVKVFATSPIITAQSSVDVDSRCKEKDTLFIPIKNTGNEVLEIRTTRLQGAAANAFSVLGWKSGTTALPLSINAKASDTLLVQYTPINGDDVAQLVLDNNDFTTARGVVSAYTVNLRARTQRPLLVLSDTIVDVGVLCIGDRAEREVRIFNSGIATASVSPLINSKYISGVSSSAFTVSSGQTRPLRIVVQSDSAGVFEDTLLLRISPCSDNKRVLIRYTVGNLKVVALPASVVRTIPLGKTLQDRVVVRITNTNQATVTDITLDNPQPGLQMSVVGTLPRIIQATDSIEVLLTYSPTSATLYRGNIIVNAKGICNARTIVPLDLLSTSADITVNKSSLTFFQKCTADTVYDTVEVWSKTQSVPTLDVPIIVGSADISVVEPRIPVEVSRDSANPTRVVVRYVATTVGKQQGRLRLTIQPNGGTTELPITTEFITSQWVLAEKKIDYGRKSGCDADTSSRITFTNSGISLLNIRQLEPLASWISVSAPTVDVPVNGSAQLTITCRTQQLPTGNSQQVLRFVDDVCGDTNTLLVLASRLDGQLTISPAFIDVGLIQTGETRDTFILITNATSLQRRITEFSVSPAQHWQLLDNLQGTTVEPQSVVRATIRFAPTQAGSHPATIKLSEVERCSTSSEINVLGSAFDPIEPPTYSMRFSVADYKENPNKQISIPVQLQSTVPVTEMIDSVEIVLRLPEFLQQVQNVVAPTNRNIAVNWNYQSPTLTIGLKSTVGNELAVSGALAEIQTITKAALPDSASIGFLKKQVFTKHNVDVITDDGSLVVEICGPRFGLKFLSTTSVIIPNPIESGQPLSILSDASEPDVLHCSVYSLEGMQLMQSHHNVIAGSSTIQLQNTFAAGVYVLRIQSVSGANISQIVIIQ